MVNRPAMLSLVPPGGSDPESDEVRLDAVFQALSDPTRREILRYLDGHALLVSELAARFEISLQGVSRHIQVLVRAGLINQERTGRISRCSLTAGPLYDAAVWLNQYTKYWQQQFDVLATTLAAIDARRDVEAPRPARRKVATHKSPGRSRRSTPKPSR